MPSQTLRYSTRIVARPLRPGFESLHSIYRWSCLSLLHTPRRCAAIAAVLLTVAVTCGGGAVDASASPMDVPFRYDGDSLRCRRSCKRRGQPWYLATPRLGTPDGQAMYDYPCADTLDILLVKVIGIFERRPAVVFNLVYLLTYPLTALAMLYAARRLALGWTAAVAAGVLFAFLPYHALRGQHHLFLTTFFPVPFLVTVVVEIAMGRLPFFPEGDDGRTRFCLTDGRTVWAAVTALVCGAANPYYGFFALLLLPVAGLGSDRWRRRRPYHHATPQHARWCPAFKAEAGKLHAEGICWKFTQLLFSSRTPIECAAGCRGGHRDNRPLNENSATLGQSGRPLPGPVGRACGCRPVAAGHALADGPARILFGTFGGPACW